MSAALLEVGDTVTSSFGAFRVSKPPQAETYSPGTGRTVVSRILPLFSFHSTDGLRRLRKPLMLKVALDEGEVFVENAALGLFGNGPTLQAAVERFSCDVAYFWSYYRSLNPSEVAGEGARLKAIYEDLAS